MEMERHSLMSRQICGAAGKKKRFREGGERFPRLSP